jgi:hypothetical protein
MATATQEPATPRQLWALHCLTHTDTRGSKLSKAEASAQISALMDNKATKPAAKREPAQVAKHPADVQIPQGVMPAGQTDTADVEARFAAWYAEHKSTNPALDNMTPGATVGCYSFTCRDCLLGRTSTCAPKWSYSSRTTTMGTTVDVSYRCDNFEGLMFNASGSCRRPERTQCHRKAQDNKCLGCAYFHNGGFSESWTRRADFRWIPTDAQRSAHINEGVRLGIEHDAEGRQARIAAALATIKATR